MSPHFRSVVLALLVLAFFIFGGAAVLYAQGWRINIRPFSAAKIGGIYLRPYPADADISVNGKPAERTAGIFERGVLVTNLFPGNYDVSVSKKGFHEWRATLPVEPSVVTARPHVVLVPQEGEIATSGAARIIALRTDSALALSNKSIEWKDRLVPGEEALASLGDGQAILTRSKGAYYLTPSGNASSTNLSKTFPRLNLPLRGYSFMDIPGNGLSFLMYSSSSIQSVNPVAGTAKTIQSGASDITAADTTSSRLVWTRYDAVKKISYVFTYDLDANNFIGATDSVPGRIKRVIATGDSAVVLAEDGSLYVLSGDGNRVKIGQGVSAFAWMPQQSLLAFADERGLNVVSGSGDYVFLSLTDPQSVRSISWYRDGYHLFVEYPDKTIFLGTEDGAWNGTVAGPAGSFYSVKNDALLYIKEGALMTLNFPG